MIISKDNVYSQTLSKIQISFMSTALNLKFAPQAGSYLQWTMIGPASTGLAADDFFTKLRTGNG
jgi:hypothetical protein